MNEVSIIINGVRYDAVDIYFKECSCDICDILEYCEADHHERLRPTCCKLIGENKCFKKSDKKFEK